MAESRFHTILRRLVEEDIRRVAYSVVRSPIQEHGGYREECGYVRGLETALKFCEQIEQEFDKQ